MKELVVLSGKGGTGKTSIVGSFAALASGKILADCDVDAADLHLLLSPVRLEKHGFWSGQTAVIDDKKCTRCGLCQSFCRFRAIDDYTVDAMACEGCGFCARICPAGAITMEDTLSGEWFVSRTDYGQLVHARLGIAQENSGKLVTTVRNEARRIAGETGNGLIITDGPPGIGCPVISSLSGASLALLVTEPTLSGLHDLERVLDVCGHFSVPAAVCINKYDINEENSREIERFSRERGIPLVARIPFNNTVTEAMTAGVPVVKYRRDGLSADLENLWDTVSDRLNG